MTRNQIDYQKHIEEQRHNLAMEEVERNKAGESQRHNLATEQESARHNVASESETNRSNVANERVRSDVNVINAEHYRQQDAETQRSNYAREEQQRVSQLENERHNLVSEQIALIGANAQSSQARAALENAIVNARNADTLALNALINERGVAVRETEASIKQQEADISQQRANSQAMVNAVQAGYITSQTEESRTRSALNSARAQESQAHTAQMEQQTSVNTITAPAKIASDYANALNDVTVAGKSLTELVSEPFKRLRQNVTLWNLRRKESN